VSQLRQAVTAAVAAGQVPVTLRTPLSTSVQSLAGRIRCVQRPPEPPRHKHGHGNEGDEHGNGKGHGDHGEGGAD